MSSTRKNSPDREIKDRYPTPQWCCDGLALSIHAHFNVPEIGSLVDIGAGDGRIGRTVAKNWIDKSTSTIKDKIFIDIDIPSEKHKCEQWIIKDFLDIELVNHVDLMSPTLFVSNPPFSLSDEIIKKTITFMYKNCANKSVAIFLQKLNWLGSGRRAKFINLYPPTKFTVLSPRPSFCKKKRINKEGKTVWSNTDSCEYAWIWWEMNKDIYDDSPLVEVYVNPNSSFI